MEIIAFEPGMAQAVAGLYNELVEPLPECHPATLPHFESLDALKHKELRDEQMMVAREGAHVIGFVHIGVLLPAARQRRVPGEPPVIRFLSYRVGERRVGQALLEWAEGWAKEQGHREIYAWPSATRYPFYHFGAAHLSERIGHVRGLFGMNGYEVHDSEMLLLWRDYEPPAAARPPLEFDVSVVQWDGPMAERLGWMAKASETQLGFCSMDWGQHSRPDASEWCYCNSLEVKEELQGRRLGMFLLGTALAAMKEKGCKHAAISTNGTNYRAQLMYTNVGYQFADLTYGYRKQLGG